MRSLNQKTRFAQNRLFYAANCFFPLIHGLVFYVVFRRDTHISVFILRFLQMPPLSGDPLPLHIGRFLNNHACDILWAYSLTFAVSWVLGYSRKRQIVSLVLCILLGSIMEFHQLFQWSGGTFDVLDILFETLAICTATILIFHHEEVGNEKSSAVV